MNTNSFLAQNTSQRCPSPRSTGAKGSSGFSTLQFSYSNLRILLSPTVLPQGVFRTIENNGSTMGIRVAERLDHVWLVRGDSTLTLDWFKLKGLPSLAVYRIPSPPFR